LLIISYSSLSLAAKKDFNVYLEYKNQYNFSDHSNNKIYAWTDNNYLEAKFLTYYINKLNDDMHYKLYLSASTRWDNVVEEAYLELFYKENNAIYLGVSDYYTITYSLKRNAFDNGMAILPQGTNRYYMRSGFTTLFGIKYEYINTLSLFDNAYGYNLYFGYGVPYILKKEQMDLAAFGFESPYTKIDSDKIKLIGFNLYDNNVFYGVQYSKSKFHFEKEREPTLNDFMTVPLDQATWFLWLNPEYKDGDINLLRTSFKYWFLKDYQINIEYYKLDFYNNLISKNNEEGSKGFSFVSRKYYSNFDIYYGVTSAKSNSSDSVRNNSYFVGYTQIFSKNLITVLQFDHIRKNSWFAQKDYKLIEKEWRKENNINNVLSLSITFNF
jgi:hypothetical protein